MAKKREARFIISAENKTAATLSKVNSDVSRLGGTFQKFGKLVGPALATLATGAAIKGFANMIQRVNGVTDSLAKQSDRLGIATEALQGYRNAASLAGVTQASLEKGIAKLNRTIGEIKTGIITATSPQVKAFEALGVSIADIQNQSPEVVFEDLVERLGKIPDAATKSALAMTLFGRSGQEMITLFNEGNPAIAQSRELLKGLGLEISRIDASKAERANDSFERLGQVVEAAKQKLGIELAPVLEGVFNQMLATGKEGQNMGERIESGVADALTTIDKILGAFRVIGGVFEVAGLKIAEVVSGIYGDLASFAESLVEFFGSDIPRAFSYLLEAAEKGLTKLEQGFRDFGTSIANAVIGAMNGIIGAIEGMVNKALPALNRVIDAANNANPFGGSISRLPGAKLERINPEGRVKVTPYDLGSGEINGGGEGARDFLQGLQDDFYRNQISYAADAAQAAEDTKAAWDDLWSNDASVLPPKPIEDTAAALDMATDSANGFSEALGGGGGSGTGSKGSGAKGAMKSLGEESEKTAESIRVTFDILNEYGQSVTSSLERGIDDFVRSGKLSLKDFAASVISDLAAITAKAAILGGIFGNSQYGGNGSGLVGAALSGIFSGATNVSGAPRAVNISTGQPYSFDGGGFTGYGARAGGIDGKGGFAAILHPDETVVDHKSGGGGSMGDTHIHQTIMVRETIPAGQARAIANAAKSEMRAENMNGLNRGGNRAKALRGQR